MSQPTDPTTLTTFRYLDKGNLATIGRARTVADLHAIRLSGFPAWVTWLVVHIFYLVGFQNRLIVAIRWFLSFATHSRGDRLNMSTTTTEDHREILLDRSESLR
jgi:NADH dehydrogenase